MERTGSKVYSPHVRCRVNHRRIVIRGTWNQSTYNIIRRMQGRQLLVRDPWGVASPTSIHSSYVGRIVASDMSSHVGGRVTYVFPSHMGRRVISVFLSYMGRGVTNVFLSYFGCGVTNVFSSYVGCRVTHDFPSCVGRKSHQRLSIIPGL